MNDDGYGTGVEDPEGTDKPYFLKKQGMQPGGLFTRQGASAAPASFNLIQKMVLNSGGLNFEF